MNIGFIGLGRMGLPMARSLAKAGYPLVVYNRTAERIAALAHDADSPVAAVERPADVARRADVIITMLAHGQAVDAVMYGHNGILGALGDGKIVLEMSTIGPDHATRLSEDAQRRGAALLDAPVSGSVHLAESAMLTTLVGGQHDAFLRARRVLSAMTREQLWLGPSGSGAAMKLAINGIIAATNHAVAEALVVAERYGINREMAYDAIGASAVASPFVAYKREAFVAPNTSAAAFSMALLAKDVDLYISLADRLGVAVVTAPAIREALGQATASQGGDGDIAGVAEWLRSGSGMRQGGENE